VHAGAGVALADAVHHLELAHRFAVLVALPVDAAVALDLHLEPVRQGVHDRHADPVQAAGKVVAAAVELAAGVQAREDQLDTGNLVLRVHVHGHAAAVVDHFHGAVRVQRHVDFPGVAGERLVDAVVHHLLHQVIGSRGVGVHAGTPAHRLQPGKHLQ
jgi:hypothetical protein